MSFIKIPLSSLVTPVFITPVAPWEKQHHHGPSTEQLWVGYHIFTLYGENSRQHHPKETPSPLCDPEPDSLHYVARNPVRPHDGIKSRFPRGQIGLGRLDKVRPLDDPPEEVQAEIDGDPDVVRDERLVLEPSRNGVKPVEQDDQAEENQGSIAEIWLERTLEGQLVAIDVLSMTGVVEPDVRDVDADPGEEGGDCCQVLEPETRLEWRPISVSARRTDHSKTVFEPEEHDMYVKRETEHVIRTHQIGTPCFVHLSRNLGACRFCAMAYK